MPAISEWNEQGKQIWRQRPRYFAAANTMHREEQGGVACQWGGWCVMWAALSLGG